MRNRRPCESGGGRAATLAVVAGLSATAGVGGAEAPAASVFAEVPGLALNLPDPCVIEADGVRYLVATGSAEDGRALPMYRQPADEPVDGAWEPMGGAVARGEAGAWNGENFWAPELHRLDGRYYLYYTAKPRGTEGNAGNRVGVAVADDPSGPFEDLGVVVPHGSLDGSVFEDVDGRRYLLYTTEVDSDAGFPPGRVLIDRLETPARVAGEPAELIGWHGWQEGASMLRRGGRYYVLFSNGDWQTERYCVRWAWSDHPGGPFVEPEPGRPLLATARGGLPSAGSDGEVVGMVGPGHGFPWRGRAGRWRYVFHAWDAVMSRRSPRFAALGFDATGRPRLWSSSVEASAGP